MREDGVQAAMETPGMSALFMTSILISLTNTKVDGGTPLSGSNLRDSLKKRGWLIPEGSSLDVNNQIVLQGVTQRAPCACPIPSSLEYASAVRRRLMMEEADNCKDTHGRDFVELWKKLYDMRTQKQSASLRDRAIDAICYFNKSGEPRWDQVPSKPEGAQLTVEL